MRTALLIFLLLMSSYQGYAQDTIMLNSGMAVRRIGPPPNLTQLPSDPPATVQPLTLIRNRGDKKITVLLLNESKAQCGELNVNPAEAVYVNSCGKYLRWHTSHQVKTIEYVAGHGYEISWTADGWNILKIAER